MNSIDVNFQGFEEVEKKLSLITDRMANNATRRALRQGLNVMRDQARANAKAVDDPRTPENIAKNVVVTGGGRKLERKVGGVMMRLGVRGGAKGHAAASGEVKGKGKGNPGGDTFYWRFLEFGTQHIAARPFLRDAANKKSQEALNKMIVSYSQQLDKEVAKL